MARTTREQWERRLERWQRSGLTTREFAAREGLRPSTLAYWRWRLKAESKAELRATFAGGAEAGPRKRARSSSSSRAEFMAVELVTASARGDEVEIIVDGALRVRVAPGFDEATLRSVVGILREAAR